MVILFNKGVQYRCYCGYQTDDYQALLAHQDQTGHAYFNVLQ